jgi:hypothetical protein
MGGGGSVRRKELLSVLGLSNGMGINSWYNLGFMVPIYERRRCSVVWVGRNWPAAKGWVMSVQDLWYNFVSRCPPMKGGKWKCERGGTCDTTLCLRCPLWKGRCWSVSGEEKMSVPRVELWDGKDYGSWCPPMKGGRWKFEEGGIDKRPRVELWDGH